MKMKKSVWEWDDGNSEEILEPEIDEEIDSLTTRANLEILQYLSSPIIKRNVDPYEWWENNKCSYPLLHKLMKKMLSAPVSSVYSERLFSEAGNVLEERRSRLSATNSEKLIFLHHNLPRLNMEK